MEDQNNTPTPVPQPNNNNPAPASQHPTLPQPAASAQDIASALLNAQEQRSTRIETGIVKSFAEQYGMSEDDVKGILSAEKQKRAAQLSPEAQAQIDRAHKLLIAADVRTVGAQMGLLDADAALALMPEGSVTIDKDGKTQGTQEAFCTL